MVWALECRSGHDCYHRSAAAVEVCEPRQGREAAALSIPSRRRGYYLDKPGSLRDDEVYGLVAFLLASNELIPQDAVIDAASLPKVRMPARDHFVPDTRGTPKPPTRRNRD